ncbi:MAG TPA: endo alpha-1,4 polygalactosaminidase [Polyangiaceae bacterium]|nr:endo alpha-1,4 polygalactosaminidase [Polyangiaceae bacterium]
MSAPVHSAAPPSSVRAPGVAQSAGPAHALVAMGPGFPASGPWVAFYGTAAQMGDLERVAQTFRIIDIDVDPAADGVGNFTDEQIRVLKNDGQNRVLSYLNLGSCERFRTYWSRAPEGLMSCGANREAWLGAYEGYPDEVWMNPANPAYQRLILEHVAPRLAARGIDGFYLDNLEVVEHSDPSESGWCSSECRQGGLDLVRRLRERFPDHLFVMQNAAGDVTRLGATGGAPFPTLLDGIAHEEVYSPAPDATAERQLLLWQSMHVTTKGGRPLFIGVEDYVGSCERADAARAAYDKSRAHGFSPYVSDASSKQRVVCFWPF